MAIRILKIYPKPTSLPSTADKVSAHLTIDKFEWIDDVTQKRGVTGRNVIFDWIVNKKGKAYIITNSNETLPVYGAIRGGEFYIRSVKDGMWTDDILSLESMAPQAAI